VLTALDTKPVAPRQTDVSATAGPLRICGKFLFAGDEKFYIRGVTYGPFRPGEHGEYGPPDQVASDFARMADTGINTVRIYTLPPDWFMDAAAEAGLRVMVGVPWGQHLPFLDGKKHFAEARERVRIAARTLGSHPALLAIAVGNEIPTGVVRWYGPRRIERALKTMCDEAKRYAPEALVTYVNYPPTEYLELPFLDFLSFNVFLERRSQLEPYLARLQNLAGERPLVMTEIGLDSMRNGEDVQAESVAWQVRAAYEAGSAGAIVFSWTDEWHRGGNDILDWGFGLTDRDRCPKPSLRAVGATFAEVPCEVETLPSASVVVCTYNGGRTIRRTLETLQKLDYPNYEVIVIDDGSKDNAAAIAAEFPTPLFRLIRTENRGLSSARNTGYREARGEIIAYIDDDAFPDPHWLQYLAHTLKQGHAGAGGPNVPVPGDGWVAGCITNAPGNPTHVLLSDTVAEHVPGCNMAYWKWALELIGGFDTQFRIAGDDVDLCWRLQECGHTLGFSAAALVWHHRRCTVRTFWRQQRNYGRAEADLERKWPEKYNAIGHATWTGRLYNQAVPGWPLPERRRIYHGVWGVALFQHVYPTHHSVFWSLPLMPEWYAVMALVGGLAILGLVWPPMLLFVSLLVGMTIFAAAQAVVHAIRARFPAPSPSRVGALRMRVLVAFLYVMQPVARLAGRLHNGLTPWRLRGVSGVASPLSFRKEAWCKHWHDPSARLAELEGALKRAGGVVLRGHEFARWDLELRGGLFGRVRLRQFTADLAHSAQYVQYVATPRLAPMGVMLFMFFCALCWAAIVENNLILAGLAWCVAALVAMIALRELLAAMATARATIRERVEDTA
jgi:O-antigen biosynthesis protein